MAFPESGEASRERTALNQRAASAPLMLLLLDDGDPLAAVVSLLSYRFRAIDRRVMRFGRRSGQVEEQDFRRPARRDRE